MARAAGPVNSLGRKMPLKNEPKLMRVGENRNPSAKRRQWDEVVEALL